MGEGVHFRFQVMRMIKGFGWLGLSRDFMGYSKLSEDCGRARISQPCSSPSKVQVNFF